MIEKGIPIPVKMRRGGAPRTSPIHAMNVGDSILFPTEQQATNASVTIYRAGKKGTRRKVEGGWRVWRTA